MRLEGVFFATLIHHLLWLSATASKPLINLKSNQNDAKPRECRRASNIKSCSHADLNLDLIHETGSVEVLPNVEMTVANKRSFGTDLVVELEVSKFSNKYLRTKQDLIE